MWFHATASSASCDTWPWLEWSHLPTGARPDTIFFNSDIIHIFHPWISAEIDISPLQMIPAFMTYFVVWSCHRHSKPSVFLELFTLWSCSHLSKCHLKLSSDGDFIPFSKNPKYKRATSFQCGRAKNRILAVNVNVAKVVEPSDPNSCTRKY